MTANTYPGTVLLIGGGSVGARHIGNLKTLGVTVLAAERDASRRAYLAETYRIPVYADYRRQLDRADAVIVCTPTNAHVAPVLAALSSGCHVLVEKPLSHTMTGVDEMLRTARDAKLVLMVGFNLRFHPAFARMQEMLRAGSIGRLVGLKVHAASHFMYRAPFHTWRDYRQDYAARKVGGGVILDLATHHLDAIVSLRGWPRSVFCELRQSGLLELKSEDMADMLLRFEDGLTANLHANFVQQPYRAYYELIGETGTITWDVTDNIVRWFEATSTRWTEYPVPDGFNHDQTYVSELETFFNCITQGNVPPVDGEAGKRVLEIALAAKRSGRLGRLVQLKAE